MVYNVGENDGGCEMMAVVVKNDSGYGMQCWSLNRVVFVVVLGMQSPSNKQIIKISKTKNRG